MMPAMLIVSGLTCLGLAIYANHLYEDRSEVQERLNLVSGSYRDALDDMEAMRNAAPDIPAPACDPFLEVADLRRQLKEATDHAEELDRALQQATENFYAQCRSNASLRGQITKQAKKKK